MRIIGGVEAEYQNQSFLLIDYNDIYQANLYIVLLGIISFSYG